MKPLPRSAGYVNLTTMGKSRIELIPYEDGSMRIRLLDTRGGLLGDAMLDAEAVRFLVLFLKQAVERGGARDDSTGQSPDPSGSKG